MRILHVFDHSLPLQSGYVTRSLGIIAGQRSFGWETVHLTSPRNHQYLKGTNTFGALTFFRSPEVRTTKPILREVLEMRATRRALESLVRSEKPDLLHAHSPVLNCLPAIAVGRKFGIPVVYEIRALWEDAAVDLGHARPGSLRYRASRALESYALSRVDRIAVLCNPLRDEIIARGIPGERVTVVPNAIDSSFLSPSRRSHSALKEKLGIGEGPVIGFIGSFYAYEGLDLLLAAVPKLAERIPNFAVLLVGGGPDEARLRHIVQTMDISHFVRFTGRVHHDEVKEYYDLVDICVYPRRKMRLTDLVTPLKPLEAMARVKPVLASDVGGHRELIAHGATGFLFPAGDVDALTNALVSVLSKPPEARKVAVHGEKHVRESRSWDAVATMYKTIYEALVELPRNSQVTSLKSTPARDQSERAPA